MIAGATLIETETARLSDTKTANVLKTVPMNARWLWAFLNLTPNFVGQPEGYRFGGGRSNQAMWSIDGTSFFDGVSGALGPQANYIESFQEVKVDVGNNSAEFGAVGQLTIVTKSGTNQLHGSVFDYYSTPMFRARSPFALTRGTGVFHLYGGSIGGPVFIPKVYDGRNKTFFFTSIESSIGGNSTTLFNPTVPLQPWRNGDFSSLLPGVTIYDPTTGQPFEGNRIPASRINPVSQKIQDRFYPLPNFGNTGTFQAQNFREERTRAWDPSTYGIFRGDQHISANDIVYGRYTFTTAPVRPYEGNLPAIGQRIQNRTTHSATVSYTHMFSPTTINEARWGMNLNNNPLQGPINGPDIVRELGLVGLAPDLPDIGGLLKVNWTGLGLQPITQVDWTDPGYRNHTEQFQDHVSIIRGRHNFKVGFDLSRVEWDDAAANASLFGNVTFSNRFTGAGRTGQGHAYADFLLGIPTTAARAFAPIRVDRNRWQTDFFFVDEFKISSKLTLNYGLRYELHKPWRENGDRMAMFDIGTGSIVIPDGALDKVSSLFPKNYVPIIEAKTAGLPSRSLMRTDKNNFAPRISAAYRPWDNNTVFRGGYGIYYDITPRNLTIGVAPFVLNEQPYTNPATNPDVIFPRVFPSAGTAGASTATLPGAVNPDIKIPYSMQYSFSVDHQRWGTGFRATYLATNTRQGEWAYNYNSPVPDSRPYVDKPRPFPLYPDIIYYTNGAGHQYHAMTIEANRKMSKGLYFQSGWTWARDTYDLNPAELSENPFDRKREFAVSRSIPTHRWVSNWVYELPVGKGRHWGSDMSRVPNLIFGGWELSGVYTVQTGQFLTPLWSGPDTTGTAFTTSRTPANVTRRPDVLRDPNLPADQRTLSRWFDVGAFAAPQLGQFGNAAKGIIKGPGIHCFNAGLHKNFAVTEAFRMRAELTAINFLNHPNWSNPGTTITSTATAGVVTGVGQYDSTGARQFRLGLRAEW